MIITPHSDIPVIETVVKNKFLGLEGTVTKCKIFAVSSYKDHTLTAKILLDDGAIFDYIPFHAFGEVDFFDLKDLVYSNSPDWNICVTEHRYLKNKLVSCWFKYKQEWVTGAYICTVDWYKDNECFNIVVLLNGQIACVPNHKMLVTNKSFGLEFKNYKKIKETWKI